MYFIVLKMFHYFDKQVCILIRNADPQIPSEAPHYGVGLPEIDYLITNLMHYYVSTITTKRSQVLWATLNLYWEVDCMGGIKGAMTPSSTTRIGLKLHKFRKFRTTLNYWNTHWYNKTFNNICKWSKSGTLWFIST